jgi:mannose-1-phosphate guanylyltransferase
MHGKLINLKQANDNKLVIFGIVPTDANTGYGYIKSLKNGQVEAFVEKPDLQTAQSYLKQGSYLYDLLTIPTIRHYLLF